MVDRFRSLQKSRLVPLLPSPRSGNLLEVSIKTDIALVRFCLIPISILSTSRKTKAGETYEIQCKSYEDWTCDQYNGKMKGVEWGAILLQILISYKFTSRKSRKRIGKTQHVKQIHSGRVSHRYVSRTTPETNAGDENVHILWVTSSRTIHENLSGQANLLWTN